MKIEIVKYFLATDLYNLIKLTLFIEKWKLTLNNLLFDLNTTYYLFL
jgi:hypothetical protein